MCGWWYPRFKDLKELLNKHVFHIFDVDLRLNLVICMTCDEQLRTCEEHIRTFKHIQGNLNNYYHTLILNSYHGNTKNKLGKWIIPFGGGGDFW